jgi:hypothetical protein
MMESIKNIISWPVIQFHFKLKETYKKDHYKFKMEACE